jgi:beta-glucosidase-like glycosyl hydrolase
VDFLLKTMEKIPLGGLFVGGAKREEHIERIGRLQAASRIPIVVAADLENGAGSAVAGATRFPDALALAAAARLGEIPIAGKSPVGNLERFF